MSIALQDERAAAILAEAVVHGVGVKDEQTHRTYTHAEQMELLARQLARLAKEKKAKDSSVASSSESEHESSDGDDHHVKDDASATQNDEGVVGARQTGPMLFFKSGPAWHCIYKAMLPIPTAEIEQAPTSEITAKLRALGQDYAQGACICYLLLAGGHFAGAVLQGERAHVHKSLHRYVVRAKRGTVQSVRDSKSATKQPKSAGANLRRYNEAQLQNDIAELLAKWASLIERCKLIFVRVSINQRHMLLAPKDGKKASSLLDRTDERIRAVPFPTSRPSYNEIRSIATRLERIYPVEGEPEFMSQHREEHAQLTSSAAETAKRDQTGDADEQSGPADTKLFDLCQAGDQEAVLAALDTIDRDTINTRHSQHQGQTCLHAAARKGLSQAVDALLEAGADPTVCNDKGAPPYAVAKNKDVRDTFRRFMGKHPGAFDYKTAHIPSPLTPETEEKQRRKKQAKKQENKLEQARRQEEFDRQKAAMREAEAEETAQRLHERMQKRGPTMTKAGAEREKRAQAALMRLQAQAGPSDQEAQERSDSGFCSYCGKTLPAPSQIVSRLDFRYCSMDCLKRHKSAMLAR